MKLRRWHLTGWGVFLLALLLPAWSAPDPKKRFLPPPQIVKLAWLAGDWRLQENGRVVDEQWMAPGGGVMLGMTRTVVRGRMVGHENRQIRSGPGGGLYFVLLPAGQDETLYQVATLDEGTVTFTNPTIDFPRTISYTLKPDGTLVVANEGTDPDGQPKRIEETYKHYQPEKP